MNNLLFIGLNGFAGSGKDTVAKMIKTILLKNWESLEECKNYYKSIYTNPTISATFNINNENLQTPVMCIAYADQLKDICANIFGLPVERFYMNKSNAWICINDQFQYTEIMPNEQYIITAEDYYCNNSYYSSINNGLTSNNKTKYWMSLREILVYVGTYVLQQDINKEIFINIVRNKINQTKAANNKLKYIIVTDNRFSHEVDFIRENNGIMLTIIRNGIEQLNNIAEHDLDDETNYDYIIENNNGYDELFEIVWNILHDDIEFKNITIDLNTRDNINNYLRLIEEDEDNKVYKLCAPMKLQKVYHNFGEITMIDPIGGPTLCLNDKIKDEHNNELNINKILFENNNFKLICN